MLYLMELTLTTNITSRDSLVGAPPDTNRFLILKRNKEFLTGGFGPHRRKIISNYQNRPDSVHFLSKLF